jgi:hypothetical protein
VDLTWTAPGDDGTLGTATDYIVRYSLSPITDANFDAATEYAQAWVPQAAGAAEARTLSGFADDTTLYFALKARDEVPNTSDLSNVVSAVIPPDTTPPAAIGNLAASEGTSAGTVDLTWTAPGDNGTSGTASSYVVKYATALITAANFDAATTYAQTWTPLGGGAAEFHSLSGLTEGQTYYFAIKTEDESANLSAISNVVSAAPPDTTAPSAVSNLVASSGAAAGTVDLSWTATGDDGTTGTAAAYVVKYALSPIGEASFASAVTFAQSWTPLAAGNLETRTVTGLTPWQTYYFAIRVQDEVPNSSAVSNSPSGSPPDTTAPDAVTDLSASVGSSPGSVDLTWTATGDDLSLGTASAYVVKYSTSPITAANFGAATTFVQSWTPLAAGNTENRSVTGLAAVTTYYFALKAEDEIPNTSAISNTAISSTGVHAVGWIGGGASGWQTGNAPASGTGDQSFDLPYDVCVDGSGNVYVADTNNHRVCKWDAAGNAQGWIGGGQDGWQTGTAPAGGAGDYRSFAFPSGVAVDASGNLYVADYVNHRVCKWNASGTSQGWIGGGANNWQTAGAPSSGSDYQSFSSPYGLSVASGYLYIADAGLHRVAKWSVSGQSAGWIGGGSNGWQTGNGPFSSGTDYQSFTTPWDAALDSSGNIYVAELGNERVSKWNASGNAVGWIGGGTNGWQTGTAPSSGTDYQSFFSPARLCLDRWGDLLVGDYNNHRLCKWTTSGNAVGWIGGGTDGWQIGAAPASGGDLRSFLLPLGLCADSSGFLYAADSNNHRVSKWHE